MDDIEDYDFIITTCEKCNEEVAFLTYLLKILTPLCKICKYVTKQSYADISMRVKYNIIIRK